ncbi:MAG: redox-sensing transcriptional repressor Rex [Chloroflexota bacterium]|jgi:redox-sensing transcriptional repressor|nr:redox-sensing transcriptional repressor Rex [Chloroflexota bacterium]MEC8440307.1 redox-sensing transcriptional repressor Rex [Chloroflexota bacterium]MEC8713481.1 redox-sensing transcriptional repressor Rex [Chloroflexota bacterium]|tara:strand:+ start:329 stop:997 length:669 start_codon:yes stop_codon:yes gene_type:complete
MKKNISNKSYINSEIPSIVLDRMAIYLRVLNQLQQEMKKLTSSKELSNYLPVEPGQIRKDLNYLGKFGINGKGYNVKNLKKTLQKQLGLEAKWNAVIIGGGRLGKSSVEFMKQKKSETFRIVAAFDPNKRLIGKKISNLKIQNMKDLSRTVKSRNIKIGIIATENNNSQIVAESLIENELNYILNFSSFAPKVPDYVILKNIDPGLQVESMSYHLRQSSLSK